MLTHQRKLGTLSQSQYILRPGIGVPEHAGGHDRRWSGFFVSAAWLHPLWAGRVWEPSGSPALRPVRQPARFRSPNWRWGAAYRTNAGIQP